MQPVSVNLAPRCKSLFLLGPPLGSHQSVTLQLGSSSSDPSFFLQLLIYRGPPHALHLQFIHLSNVTEYLTCASRQRPPPWSSLSSWGDQQVNGEFTPSDASRAVMGAPGAVQRREFSSQT